MPEFFVPSRPDPSWDRHWWRLAQMHANAEGFNCGVRKIFRLVRGGDVVAEVGQPSDTGGGFRVPVGAIFDDPESYVIYGMEGSMRGIPKTGLEAIDFD